MSNNNLLFVGPWPPPFGGIASNLYELLPVVNSKGYNVYVLSYTDEENEISKNEKGVQVIYFAPSTFFKRNSLSVFFRALKQLKHKNGLSLKRYIRAITISERVNRLVRNEQIDFVFTYDNDQLHLSPFITKKTTGYPKIFCSIYGAFFLNPSLYETEKQFLINAIQSTDRILSCSKYCVDSGKSYLGIDYPTKVIYNNVDELIFKPENDGSLIREKYNIANDAIVLMTMGRIGVDMGIDFLLRSLTAITSIDNKIIVFFVGATAELCNQVEEVAKENAQVRFAFNIPIEEKHNYFAACDIFTAPTKEKHACMGIANIEAMMSGKAVISSTSGGHPETIENNVSGILVPFDSGKLNVNIYLDKLAMLVFNREIREKYGFEARKRALALFTNKQIVEEHLDLIREYK
jgi:glycosyltransferase involved in cell wall biosynthesis